jgi:hypothetical protein
MSEIQWFGFGLFLLGSSMETIYEIQRKSFKKNHNEQLYTKGLASFVQHPNYLGHFIFRTSYAFMTKQWILLLVPAFFLYDFMSNSIPDLDQHNKQKHGKMFEKYNATTPKLIPFNLSNVSMDSRFIRNTFLSAQLAALVMGVAVMVVFKFILGHSMFYPLRVMSAVVFGDHMLSKSSGVLPVIVGLLGHQFLVSCFVFVA